MQMIDDMQTTYDTFHKIMELSLRAKEENATLEEIERGEYPELLEDYRELRDVYEEFSGLDYEDVDPDEFLETPEEYVGLSTCIGAFAGSVKARLIDGEKWEEGSQYFNENLGWPDPDVLEKSDGEKLRDNGVSMRS